MTVVNHFSFGWSTPALSYLMSVVGCLLGFMLASKARRYTGYRRTRLLIYATVALGGIGIWQSQVIALLGVSLPAAVVRFDPRTLGLSLAVALVDVGTGLFLVARGQLRAARLLIAGLVIGLGAAATSYTVLVALRMSADVTYDPARFGTTVVLCMLLAPFALWSIAALRGLVSTVVAALTLGLVVCGIHYGGQWAMVVHFRQSTADVPGLSATTLIAPLMLGGFTVTVMLAYFTIGSSTMRELRAIYSPHENSEPIEPRLIEEVTQRVVNGTTISPLPAYLDRSRRPDHPRRASRPRPTPGSQLTWRGIPGWGTIDRNSLAHNDPDRHQDSSSVEVVGVGIVRVAETGTALPKRTVSKVAATAADNVDLAAIPEAVMLAQARRSDGQAAAQGASARRWRNRRRA